MFEARNVVVTGGAGFIGSHLVDHLLSQGALVKVLDTMTTGQPGIVEEHKKNKNYKFKKIDIYKEPERLKEELRGIDFVFHIAANADIRGGIVNTRIDLEQNTIATYNVLEAMRLNDVKNLCFTSSAAVYGNSRSFPTTEDEPLIQTSLYGASKLASEGLIESFSEYYDFRDWIYRFVSIIGERYPHGVIVDFFRKLKKNPKELEILGNGKQKKSFLYISDCVDGVFSGLTGGKNRINIFNLGQDYTITVDQVADIIIEEMKLKNVKRVYTGGETGWKGDQKIVLLSTERIRKLGWEPKVRIEDGIKRTIRYLMSNEK